VRTVGTIWRRGGAIALVLILLLGSMPAPPTVARAAGGQQPTPSAATPRYFAETGHYVGGRFREFWEERGGLFVFGLPLTSQFAFPSTDGKVYQVQHFERAVFELHPENQAPFDVLLTQVGRESIAGRLDEGPFQPTGPAPGQPYESTTRHNIPDFFLAWWNRYGGLQNFGYPLSEAFFERHAADGKEYVVQYFERGRFELHPENSGTEYEVLLGLMGRDRMLREDDVPAFARAPETAPPGAPATIRLGATGLPILQGAHVGLGIQAQFYGQPHAQLQDMIHDIGFSWVKQQVIWRDIEGEKGVYRWGELDQIVPALADRGTSIMLTVVRSPPWAVPHPAPCDGCPAGPPGNPRDDGTPRNPQDYGDFMRAIAQRYQGRVRAYQLWNEPNLAGEVGGRIDPAFYVEMVKAGYLAVKSVDPQAIVVLGGLASTGVSDPQVAMEDTRYLEQLYAYQGGIVRHYFDVAASHPYGLANPPDTLWSEGKPGPTDKFYDHDSFYFRRFEAHRRIMERHGDGDKQLWLTEWGWGSDKRPGGHVAFNEIDEQLRARYTIDAILMMRQRYPYLGVTFLWNLNFSVLLPPGLTPAQYDPALYAIVNDDYSPRPVYYALQSLPK